MNSEIVLRMENICKSFPGVQALNNVSFELRKGEIHALCGENGAGKSTLLKILTGIYKSDHGAIFVNGEEVNFKSISEAKSRGVSVIPQEIQMAPRLSVAENMFMANYPRKWGIFVDWKKMSGDARLMQERLGENIASMGVNAPVEDMSMGHKQIIEIMKALSTEISILALDEPTSSLSEEESGQLFKLIKDLSAQGISVIYISHKLDEIFSICDRITILRDGNYVDTKNISETDIPEVVGMMVGRNLDLFKKKERKSEVSENIICEVKKLRLRKFDKEIGFELREGEILGMFGIVGSGRTETARAIFGLDRYLGGEIFIKGQKVDIRTPREAVNNKIGFVTEDRHGEGLILRANVRWNTTLPFIKRLSKLSFMDYAEEKSITQSYIKALKIKTPSDTTLVENLSGGNQQKIVIAKWLAAKMDILIFDEPTRGIDVGAKSEMYNLITELAGQGKSIIMISSELPEILALSDRVLVFREGEITAELENNSALTEAEILKHAVQ